ncbi:MAG: undecaprenyl-diphosphate phosphatase, partial [bacterium]
FIFYNIFREFLMDEKVVLWALLLGGIFLIVFEVFFKGKEKPIEKISQISYRQAFTIGLFQSLAIIPGVSRAAATIIGGLSLGLKRKTIVEFSFLLAVPTMLAATGLDFLKNAKFFSSEQVGLLISGFITSFVVAIISVKLLLRFIKKHNFIIFGAYRIIVSFLFWLMVS